jgi:hypothetical protein
MLPPNSDPDEVISRTTPLLILVHNAFEMAAIRALEFFAPHKRRRKKRLAAPETVNSALYSALVRYYVKLALNEKGIVANEEEHEGINPSDIPYDLDNLPNNGLLLKYTDCEFRIRKKYYGKLPNPATRAMQDFYQQSLPFPELASAIQRLHLMILWNADSHFRFSGLELALPIDGGPKFAEWEWRRKIPHPALLIDGRTSEPEAEDPPYGKKKKSDTGTDPEKE